MQQYINRKELIDNLYSNRDKFKFYIYGPKFLMDLYPECYRPYDIKNNRYEVPYHGLNKIFNNSKINICTHTHCQYDGYLNERVGLILGSGGLLYIDKIKGLENIYVDGVDCVYMRKENYIEQICEIITNYDDYYKIRNNGHEKNKSHTWDKWAKYINENYISKMDSIEPQLLILEEEKIIKQDELLETIKEIKREKSGKKIVINIDMKILKDEILKNVNNIDDIEINIKI
jgi:hypothetical protein